MSIFAFACACIAIAGATSHTDEVSTFSSVGKEKLVLNGYAEAELMLHKGKGCLTHMWFGGDWKDISYLEAMMRAYINGSAEPTHLSSGLEDYFLGTYYFNRGPYSNGLAGLVHIDAKDSSFSAYRIHEDDPLFFKYGLKLTCRCGEQLDGKNMHDSPPTIFTTNAFVYEWPAADKL